MSYRLEKNDNKEIDIVISGWEKGVASSPHNGIANIQNANISTEQDEVMCSYNRVKQSQTGTTGTLTQVNTNTVSISGITLLVGQIITITDAGTTGLSLTQYYYISTGKLVLGKTPNDPVTATVVTGITSGSATFSIEYPMGNPRFSAIENYNDSSNVRQCRYYIFTSTGVMWCHDTKAIGGAFETPLWFPLSSTFDTNSTGMSILNGWLVVFGSDGQVSWGSTSKLGSSFAGTSGLLDISSQAIHSTLVGQQGKLYVTDGRYVASYFPNTSLITGNANIQSYCEYTGGSPNSQILAVIGGSYPAYSKKASARVPVIFFTQGTKPTAVTVGTIYWIDTTSAGPVYFKVYDDATAGSEIDMVTGAAGRQFFNTFYPISTAGRTMLTFTPQRLNLPFNEIAQSMVELGNNVIIGGTSNVLYPWNQVDALPSDLIYLPENNVTKMITVNQVAYVFAGNKGNIYITNGSSASIAISVPDYCAGIAGTPTTYVEPYFTWGDAMFLRGRVYFSILDQTSTKAGNCGGVWSFIPSNNMVSGQDVGMALRLENQNSYATYSGYCPVLLPAQNQLATSPQYWSAWKSDVTTPTYGIDFTGTYPSGTTVIETDLIPTGTVLQQKTFTQIEYKLSSPLASGETVSIASRQNGTDAYVDCGTAKTESATALSGYFDVNFQKGQWLQLRVTLTPLASTSTSFIRLKELRVR